MYHFSIRYGTRDRLLISAEIIEDLEEEDYGVAAEEEYGVAVVVVSVTPLLAVLIISLVLLLLVSITKGTDTNCESSISDSVGTRDRLPNN